VKRRLPLVCPSVGSVAEMISEPCTRAACDWWKNGRCSAHTSVVEEYAHYLDKIPLAPACPKASACTWHRSGPCAVRRLGMLCEHEGGEWNTWQMAPAAEWPTLSEWIAAPAPTENEEEIES
jgi:hypothetical protein